MSIRAEVILLLSRQLVPKKMSFVLLLWVSVLIVLEINEAIKFGRNTCIHLDNLTKNN